LRHLVAAALLLCLTWQFPCRHSFVLLLVLRRFIPARTSVVTERSTE
jgi:hypothetical protein